MKKCFFKKGGRGSGGSHSPPLNHSSVLFIFEEMNIDNAKPSESPKKQISVEMHKSELEEFLLNEHLFTNNNQNDQSPKTKQINLKNSKS